MNTVNEDLYKVNKQSETFYKKRFFDYYKPFVDITRTTCKEDIESYKNDLIAIENRFSGLDFNNSILFIYEKNIAKMLFLVGFSKLKKLSTFKFYTVMDISDIFFSNRRSDNMALADEDVRLSEQDIREDVLCVYGDDYMTLWSIKSNPGFMLTSTFSGREQAIVKRGRKLITWFFYKGTYTSMSSNGYCSDTLKYFESMKSEGLQIIDLNKSGFNVDIQETVTQVSSVNTQNKVKNLGDIY